MAKRFTDTGKWDKAWFRKLSPELKCIWMFLCDRCDHAGVWEIDWDALEFFVGIKTLPANLIEAFDGKLEQFGDKLVITGFADFQYGSLNPDNRVHKSVLERLKKVTPNKGLKRTLKGSKDTDTDKDKDTDTDKKGECEGENPPAVISANPVTLYCDEYKTRYGHSPVIGPKEAGILTTFAKNYPAKWQELIRGYLQMPDTWAVQRSHPVELLSSKLNEIQRFLLTGKVVTKKVAQTIEELADKAQGSHRKPRRSLEEIEAEKKAMLSDAAQKAIGGAS